MAAKIQQQTTKSLAAKQDQDRKKHQDSAVMAELNASIEEDRHLYHEDITASQAHARMLAKCRIITDADMEAIHKGLEKIKEEIEENRFTFDAKLEDIHMNVEARLHELIGDVAGKLHTARSRNDQVATDVRLALRKRCDELDALLACLIRGLCQQGLQHCKTVMPGYSHLQVAQPINFGFHLGAYGEAFTRDRHRLAWCCWRLNASPLGSAALAGTPHSIDRGMTARELGFNRVMGHAMDAVSARDHILEFSACLSIIATHLSRLAEDLILWSSQAFGFVRLADSYCSHSSIMPQKRNPDAAELIRGRSGRALATFVQLSTTVKALPQAYNKDLQEDRSFLDLSDSIALCLKAMEGMITGLTPNPEAMRNALERGYPTATDCADWLVAQGVPFRTAYGHIRDLVQMAQKQECPLHALPQEVFAKLHPQLPQHVHALLDVSSAMERRCSEGGTASHETQKSLNRLLLWAQAGREEFLHAYQEVSIKS